MKKDFIQVLKLKLLAFLTPEPEVQEDYVDKMVILLRRDFTTRQQNEIIISVAKKLSDLREQDMTDMAEKYVVLQEDMLNLKTHILCS